MPGAQFEGKTCLEGVLECRRRSRLPFVLDVGMRLRRGPSQIARRRSRVSVLFNCPEILRLRSPSTWSMAAATDAMACATAPAGGARSNPFGNSSAMKAGTEIAVAPARMLHDGGEKRDVVTDAFDAEGVERFGQRIDRLRRASAHG